MIDINFNELGVRKGGTKIEIGEVDSGKEGVFGNNSIKEDFEGRRSGNSRHW